MILTKSKIYEKRFFNSELIDEDFREIIIDNTGMDDAVEQGSIKLLRYFFDHNKYWINALIYSVGMRNMPFVDFFMTKNHPDDLNYGQYGAIYNDVINVFQYFTTILNITNKKEWRYIARFDHKSSKTSKSLERYIKSKLN